MVTVVAVVVLEAAGASALKPHILLLLMISWGL